MSRTPPAIAIGVVGLLIYVVAAVTLADALPGNWIVQGLYFAAAGLLWVVPMRSLIVWAVRK